MINSYRNFYILQKKKKRGKRENIIRGPFLKMMNIINGKRFLKQKLY